MKTRDKLIVFLLSTYLLITLLMTTFIPSMSDPFNYDYFDLDNGQMPPISSECNYGLTDGLVMTKSLENTTDSAFYFKPILSNEECFLRLHSTSTPQGKYISEENVTINYGYSFLKGRNTFLILYTLIFLFITNKLKLKENHQESFSIIPYVLSIPIFIYESFYITNILIYCLCLYLIKIRSVRIKIEDLSTILILSILFPLALYQSHVSIWFMFLISFINKESFKNIYIAIGSFFLIISSFILNKLLSIEVLNNHYFNNLYSFVYNNNSNLSSLHTYLDASEISKLGGMINDTSYYQVFDFSSRISSSAFPAKNILFLSKSPDIFSSLIVSIVIISFFCFVNRIINDNFGTTSKNKFINQISWGGVVVIAYTYILGINDFFNHNIKILTGSLREVEVIPQLFTTDWRGVLYSAEGAGEIFFLFSFFGIYSFIKSDSSRERYLYSYLSAFSIYALLLTSSSSSIILFVFSILIFLINNYLNVSLNRNTIFFIFVIVLLSFFFLPSGEEFDNRISASSSSSAIFLESNQLLKKPISSMSNLLNREVPWSGFFESYNPSTISTFFGNSSGSMSESWVFNQTQHNPHSIVLYILYCHGFIGIILFIALMFYLFNISLQNNKIYFIPFLSSLVLINNLKSDNMILFNNALFISILIGISISLYGKNQ